MKAKITTLPLSVVLLAASAASAAPVLFDEEKGVSLNVGVLAQPWFQVTGPARSGSGAPGIGAPDRSSPSFDLFLRRIRLMAYGTINENLGFFVDTDQPNLGKGGDFSTSMFVQDAFLTYQFAPELKIDAGMMLVPLSHHTIEGAAGLNAIDYHSDLVRLPAGKIFRDAGLQFRGLLFDDWLHYRVGVFEGVRASAVPAPAAGQPPRAELNATGVPRVAGQLRLNLLGSEGDFFLKGIYFASEPIFSIGIGADWQANAVYKADGEPGSYLALSGDVFFEYPVSSDDEIVAKANVFRYSEGSSLIPGATALAGGGVAFYVEAGFRHDWFEPLAYVEYLKGNGASPTIVAPHGGANFWISRHAFNVKVDVGYRKIDQPGVNGAPGVTTEDILGTVGAQALF